MAARATGLLPDIVLLLEHEATITVGRAQQAIGNILDAGEIPAGHTVTALYEFIAVGMSLPEAEAAPALLTIESAAQELEIDPSELALVKIRYKDRNDGAEDPSYQINTATLATSTLASFDDADDDFRWAAAVAAFAEILKESPYAQPELLDTIIEIIEDTKVKAREVVEEQVPKLKKGAKKALEKAADALGE